MKNFFLKPAFWVTGLFLCLQSVSFAAQPDPKSLGDQLLLNHKPLQAIEKYEEALKSDPDSTATLFNMAIAYYSVRQIDHAISALEKIVAQDGKDIEAQYNLGCLLLYKGNFAKAESVFQEAKLCCGTQSPFSARLAQGLELIGQIKKSDRSTQDLLQLATQYGLPAASL